MGMEPGIRELHWTHEPLWLSGQRWYN